MGVGAYGSVAGSTNGGAGGNFNQNGKDSPYYGGGGGGSGTGGYMVYGGNGYSGVVNIFFRVIVI